MELTSPTIYASKYVMNMKFQLSKQKLFFGILDICSIHFTTSQFTHVPFSLLDSLDIETYLDLNVQLVE